MWYLTYLVQIGLVKEANIKFFQRGHTKNVCDRGFGSVKKYLSKLSCWNMETLVQAVEDAATSSKAVNPGEREKPFWNFKNFLEGRYKKVQGIQKFQLF